MSRSCCVLFCPTGKNLPSHRFPKDDAQFQLWKNAILSDKIKHLSDEQLKKGVVCYKHFKDEDYKLTAVRRVLKKEAVPSLSIPGTMNGQDVEFCNIVKSVPKANEVSVAETHLDNSKNISNTSNIQKNIVENETPKVEIVKEETSSPHTQENQSRIPHLTECQIKSTKLTRRPLNLHAVIRRLQRKERIIKQKNLMLRKGMKEARRLKKTAVMQELLGTLTETQRHFINMQIRGAKYKPQGLRFTNEEKKLALLIWQQSGKCYRFLRQIFHLPSVSTLHRDICNLEEQKMDTELKDHTNI